MHSDKVSTTASESRKSSKPIMEKRRRARINASLAELKSLLLEVIKKEGARHSKMEKADILEMTVKHLRQLQRQQFSAMASADPSVLAKYQLGFSECTSEVTRFLGTLDICDVELRTRLLNHLANCVVHSSASEVPQVTTSSVVSTTVTSTPRRPSQSCSDSSCLSPPPTPLLTPKIETTVQTSTEINNNIPSVISSSVLQPIQMTKVFSGLQVIPTKINSGEIAFVLPTNILSNGQTPNYVIPVYAPPSVSTNFATTAAAAVSAPNLFTIAPSAANTIQPCTFTSFPGNFNVISGSAVSSTAALQFPAPSVGDGLKQIPDVDTKLLPTMAETNAKSPMNVDLQPILPNNNRQDGRSDEPAVDSDGDMWRPW